MATPVCIIYKNKSFVDNYNNPAPDQLGKYFLKEIYKKDLNTNFPHNNPFDGFVNRSSKEFPSGFRVEIKVRWLECFSFKEYVPKNYTFLKVAKTDNIDYYYEFVKNPIKDCFGKLQYRVYVFKASDIKKCSIKNIPNKASEYWSQDIKYEDFYIIPRLLACDVHYIDYNDLRFIY